MSNSIWHKYDIKDMPSLTREILAKNGSHHNVCIINREDWKQGFCEWIDRWTYITDIIAQADKAEQLQKAVDIALFRLENILMDEEIKIRKRCQLATSYLEYDIERIKQLIKE